MTISLIVAASENDVIGKDNALPWHLPDDLAYFRRLTKGHAVVMGRKTFESIGRPLPDRRNIVLSRSMTAAPSGCEVFPTLVAALERLERDAADGDVFVIGGARVFRELLENGDVRPAGRIYLTRVHARIDGDVHLPAIDWDRWKKISSEEHPVDERHAYPFTFEVYERKT